MSLSPRASTTSGATREALDPRVLTVLELLLRHNDDGGNSIISHGDGQHISTLGHGEESEGDHNLSHRGLAEIMPMMELLALLFRGSRDADNTDDSEGLIVASDVSDLDLNHEYGIREAEGQSHMLSQASYTSGLHQPSVDQGPGITGDADAETQTDLDELSLHAVLEYFLHHVVQMDGGGHSSAPASKAAVAALPTLQFSKKIPDEEDTCCAVCMEVFQCQEEVREMPCKHVYHSGCILPWLELHSSCPLCRSQLPAEESSAGSSFEESLLGTDGTDVAIFDFDGDVVHVLSFVLAGSQVVEEETRLTQDVLAEAEGVAPEETAVVQANHDGRPILLQDQQGKAGADNEERKRLAALENFEAAASEHDEGGTFSDTATVSGTSVSQSSGIVSSYFSCQNSPDGDLSSEDAGSRTQSTMFGVGDASGTGHDRLARPADSDTSESWLGPRVRGLFSWVFGATDAER